MEGENPVATRKKSAGGKSSKAVRKSPASTKPRQKRVTKAKSAKLGEVNPEERIIVQQLAEEEYEIQVVGKPPEIVTGKVSLRESLLAKTVSGERLERVLKSLDETGKAETVVTSSGSLTA